MGAKEVVLEAEIFALAQMTLGDLYATRPDNRDDQWHSAAKVAAGEREESYKKLMADDQVREALCSGGAYKIGTLILRGTLIQPGKTKDNDKKWLIQSPTYHYVKLKVEGVRR